MKIFRLPDRLDRMPMLKILVFFAAGIALAGRYELPLWFLAGAFVVTGVLALSLRSSAATAAMILTAGFAAAQFRAPRATVPRGVHTVYEVTVEGFPADRGRYAVADASVAAWRDPADGRWHASDARIRLYADSLAGLHAGERIRCRGAVRPFRGGAESYRRLMARRGYAGTLWIAERTLLERLPDRHAGLHRRAVERLSRLPMSAGAAAVVEAMAAGERRGVTPELRTAYSRSGLSHLLAVSGLHTGIVFALVNLALWWLPLFRRGHLLKNLLAAVAVWLFVAAAGFPPSAVRAAAQCILPPLAFEQASSEACAAHKLLEGDTVLDLTCGLGADALFLSRRFRRVVTLERNEMLARVAAENFSRMGVANVDVVNASAEEYLRRDGLRFDWIYADPDRRSDKGRKLVRLEDCSPDIVALKPRLKQVSGRLCVKNSPLFDVGEALRLFPDSRVEVLSLGDECKEVVVYDDGTGPLVTATALGRGSFSAAPGETAPPPGRFDPERYGYLVIPDVSLQKARLARIHLAGKADIWSDNGYGFAVEEPEGVLGRTFAVESIEPYDPKRLKRELKGREAEVLKRDFPLAAEELMRRLGLHAGAGLRLAFTKIGNDFWVIRLK